MIWRKLDPGCRSADSRPAARRLPQQDARRRPLHTARTAATATAGARTVLLAASTLLAATVPASTLAAPGGAKGAPAPALAAPAGATAPLLEGMGPYDGPRASRNARARRYFEQGVTLAWGFNPAEGARSFEAAAAADPSCALCYWGLAWSLGPNINVDMDAAAAERVRAALVQARRLAPRSDPRTRALIDALSARHPADGAPLDPDEEAYAARMRTLAAERPRDADVVTLAAEALMNLHPYDWWRKDGSPQPWTAEIRALLDRALRQSPRHLGANHYWIHLIEPSPQPRDALASADRLRHLVPGSAHLLHMPAHIDMRVGRYADAAAANERAMSADKRYLEQVDAQGAYRVGYVAHNAHFLWAAAAMEGRSADALAAARAAFPAACGPRPPDRSSGILQHYYALPLHALVRFGRWREILEETLPPDVSEPYPLALWHFARGAAYAKTARVAEARRELAAVERMAADPALERARVKNINPASALVRIAALTLTADIALAEQRPTDAIAPLAQAVRIEDALAYDEPHLWLAPTRHALGAALLAANRPADAERVYREDLARYPGNGWSLAGLAAAERRQGKTAAARVSDARFRVAWRRADVVPPL
jgi:tetratricopeptide (TPR) repeat protein